MSSCGCLGCRHALLWPPAMGTHHWTRKQAQGMWGVRLGACWYTTGSYSCRQTPRCRPLPGEMTKCNPSHFAAFYHRCRQWRLVMGMRGQPWGFRLAVALGTALEEIWTGYSVQISGCTRKGEEAEVAVGSRLLQLQGRESRWVFRWLCSAKVNTWRVKTGETCKELWQLYWLLVIYCWNVGSAAQRVTGNGGLWCSKILLPCF